MNATTLAARMNARPLPEGTDGGVWRAFGHPHNVPTVADECDACGNLAGRDASVTCGILTLCLPCALADCLRAEARS